jgi:N-acetylmuramoyl-L-alanine amidase
LSVFLTIVALFGLSGASCIKGGETVTIVIDAGHGGKDPGKVRSSSKRKHEKEIALGIALKFGKLLEENTKGLKVIYTRKTDIFVPLPDRVEIANKSKAVLFVSVHCNSNPNRHITGTRTHYHDYRSKELHRLAGSFETWFKKKGRHSRGTQSSHDRGYTLYVLENTEMPAILTEVGFLTNPTEEKYLNSWKGQADVAEAIYNATFHYLKSKHGIRLKSPDPYYRVQVMASSKKMGIKHSFFTKLGKVPVTEEPVKAGKIKYKYYAGRYKTKKQADVAAKNFQKKGYQGAFVVKVEEE